MQRTSKVRNISVKSYLKSTVTSVVRRPDSAIHRIVTFEKICLRSLKPCTDLDHAKINTKLKHHYIRWITLSCLHTTGRSCIDKIKVLYWRNKNKPPKHTIVVTCRLIGSRKTDLRFAALNFSGGERAKRSPTHKF